MLGLGVEIDLALIAVRTAPITSSDMMAVKLNARLAEVVMLLSELPSNLETEMVTNLAARFGHERAF